MAAWPRDAQVLIEAQKALADAWAPDWIPGADPLDVAACFVCFDERGHGFAAAAFADGRGSAVSGPVRAPYESGLLALREGELLEAAVRALPAAPAALLVNATGLDHPRRAGLAVHLGAVLDVPTAGVTHRPLVAGGAWPPDAAGATAPLELAGEVVGYWLRTRRGARPLAVHAGWRTGPDAAVALVLRTLGGRRTPEPLRHARRLARERRASGG